MRTSNTQSKEVAASRCGNGFPSAGTGKGRHDSPKDGNVFSRKSDLLFSWGPSSGRTMTLNSQLKQHSSGLKRNCEMYWKGPDLNPTDVMLWFKDYFTQVAPIQLVGAAAFQLLQKVDLELWWGEHTNTIFLFFLEWFKKKFCSPHLLKLIWKSFLDPLIITNLSCKAAKWKKYQRAEYFCNPWSIFSNNHITAA